MKFEIDTKELEDLIRRIIREELDRSHGVYAPVPDVPPWPNPRKHFPGYEWEWKPVTVAH